MRALNKGWIGIILVILFGASLFFFRGSSRYSNLFNSDNFVANVSGTQISTTQFARSLEMNIGQFAQMIGEELTGDQIRAFQIHQLVLQNLINNAIFENEFDRLNLILDDSTIAEETKKRFPNLYVNNKINDDALNSFLRQQRLKIEDLVNIINYETRSVVFDSLFFEKNYPSELNKKINIYNNQIREINLIKIPYKELNIPSLDEEKLTKNSPEIIDFFKENSDKYMSKEKRDISYIIIDKNSFKERFQPNEKDIVTYFNNNKDLFTTPEKRSFKQFNFKLKEEAEKFKNNISGLSKDQIINFVSENNIIFNDFDNVSSNQVLQELSNAIFSINEGDVSKVISTTLAHHVIFLDQIHYEKEQKLDEVKETIRESLTNIQLDNFYNDLKLKISQQIIEGFSINEIAFENDFEIKNFSNITQDVSNKSDLEVAILNTSFIQNKEFVSDVIDFDQNISFISYVNNIESPKVEIIDNVFDDVFIDFIRINKMEYMNDVYQENINNNLSQINSIFNLNIMNQKIDLKSNDLPSSLINKIFNSQLDQISYSNDKENAYFAEVISIELPNSSENFENINLKSDFKNAFGNEIIKTKDISVNDELISGLLSQYK